MRQLPLHCSSHLCLGGCSSQNPETGGSEKREAVLVFLQQHEDGVGSLQAGCSKKS